LANETEPSLSPQISSWRQRLRNIFAAISGFFSELISKFYPPRKHAADSVPPQDNTTNAGGTGENVQPPPIRVVIDALPPPSEEQKAKKNLDEWRARWKFRAEVAGFFVICIYTYVSCNQWKTAERQLEASERPWVGVDKITAVSDFTTTDKGHKAIVTLLYNLTNGGRSPAYVLIQGRIVEQATEVVKQDDVRGQAEDQCEIGKGKFARHPLTLNPGVPTKYSIAFDGDESDSTGDHMKDILLAVAPDPLNKELHFLVHTGCILYQSTAKGGIHQTPFKAYLHIRDSRSPHPSDISLFVNGPWVIGKAD